MVCEELRVRVDNLRPNYISCNLAQSMLGPHIIFLIPSNFHSTYWRSARFKVVSFLICTFGRSASSSHSTCLLTFLKILLTPRAEKQNPAKIEKLKYVDNRVKKDENTHYSVSYLAASLW